jgi:hypothetical protein
VIVVPESGEDLAGDAERRPAVMVLLGRLREGERDPPRLFARDAQLCLRLIM